MSMIYLVLVILSYLCWISEVAIGQEVLCRTPTGQPGQCTNIKQCQPIWNKLKMHQGPLSKKQRKGLRRYSCENQSGGKSLVCCANDYLNNGRMMDPEIATENPPDVSEHENLKLLPSECGRTPSGYRIRNGRNADLGEFPWMALLFFQKVSTVEKPINRCSGSIINERYILTAAHCLCNLKYKLIYVRVGEHDLSSVEDCEMTKIGSRRCASPVQNLPVEEIILHPNHTRYQDDIALLRISKMNFTSVENVKPICLPMIDKLTAQQNSTLLIATGWGLPFSHSVSAKSILQRVQLPIFDLNKCMEVLGHIMISHRQICAGGSESMKSTCEGDSGGPLQALKIINDEVRYVQEGIVSFAPRICGTVDVPTVNTRVASYLGWIIDVIKP